MSTTAPKADAGPTLNLMPVLCGFKINGYAHNFGAIMIHVARSRDIRSEFEAQMRSRFQAPRGFKLTWWRPACWPETF
jgi:hypothetical protein